MSLPPQPLPVLPRPGDIVPSAIEQIARMKRLVISIVTSVHPATACFDNVARPLLNLENQQAGPRAVVSALKYCSPDVHIQLQAQQAEAMWEKDDPELHPDLYLLFETIRKQDALGGPEEKKYLQQKLRAFELRGYGFLDGSSLDRVQARESRIAQLSAVFHQTLRQQGGGQYFSPEELDGVPEKSWGPLAANGKHFFDYATGLHLIMRHAHHSDTRRRMQEGCHSQCSENAPRFREIILLRDENARELGFHSHAAAQLPFRSVESLDWVDALLDELANVLIPLRKVGYEELVAAKKQHFDGLSNCSDSDASLMPWDRFYYRHCSRRTRESTFQQCKNFLRLEFRQLQAQDYVWHTQVQAWTVWEKDADNTFVGYFFADLLSRPNKYKGNQSVNLQPSFLQADGCRFYPSNILMCNFYEKDPNVGCLLTHNNVVTLFHELGHSMHDLVSRTKYARHHGYQVTREFAEAIAMTLEHWCWLPEELKALSRHYTRIDPSCMKAWIADNPTAPIPPEKIPDDLLELCMQRRQSAQIDVLADILFQAKFDLCVHNPPDRNTLINLDERKLYKDLYESVHYRPIPDGSNAYLKSGHLLAGYDAGYYTYMCAKVFGADMFHTAFAANPRSLETWSRFRRVILEPGGSQNELQMLHSFLGRPPDNRALLDMIESPVHRTDAPARVQA